MAGYHSKEFKEYLKKLTDEELIREIRWLILDNEMNRKIRQLRIGAISRELKNRIDTKSKDHE